MSGSDLAGISSTARTDVVVRAAPHDGAADLNGAADDHDGYQVPSRNGNRQHAGLPSSVIHELRTPLTSIHGYAQVLQRSVRDNPRATNALGVLVRETSRLSSMLASLSELAELQSDEPFTPQSDVDVYQIVEDLVQEIVRRDAGAHLVDPIGEGRARCNATLLSQAVLHVLANATLFSPEGGPISVTVGYAGPDVEILVKDQGIGVPTADAERIYEPFERGSNARQHGCRGLGLGLFLARSSLARTGGRIEHWASDGGGTTFRLTVPRA